MNDIPAIGVELLFRYEVFIADALGRFVAWLRERQERYRQALVFHQNPYYTWYVFEGDRIIVYTLKWVRGRSWCCVVALELIFSRRHQMWIR
jgi:hypothetical protein